MLERRFNGGHLRQEEEGIRGLAAIYYREGEPGTEYQLWSGAVERIMPGAFDRAAREDDVRALFNHDPSQILGRSSANTLTLTATDEGLSYQIAPSETSTYRDVAESLRRGDVDGSSFSFEIEDEHWTKEGETSIREVRAVKLYDVGPVTFPAYKSTEAGVRSAEESYAEWQKEIEAEQDEARKRKEIAKFQQEAARQLSGLTNFRSRIYLGS